MRITLYILAFLPVMAFGQNTVKGNRIAANAPATGKTAMNGSGNIIDYPCAVIIEPDDRKIANLKKTTSVEDYNAIVDDNEYYMTQSSSFLNSAHVRQIQKESKGRLVFKTATGKTFTMPLDSLAWGILLFNGKSKPMAANIIDINSDYKRYMKK